MKNPFLIAMAAAAVLTGCATSSHKVVGTLHPPIAPELVQVYSSLPPHAEVVSMISADSFKGIDLDQAKMDALSQLKAQAAKLGANGVVVNTAVNQQPLQGARLSGQAIYVSP